MPNLYFLVSERSCLSSLISDVNLLMAFAISATVDCNDSRSALLLPLQATDSGSSPTLSGFPVSMVATGIRASLELPSPRVIRITWRMRNPLAHVVPLIPRQVAICLICPALECRIAWTLKMLKRCKQMWKVLKPRDSSQSGSSRNLRPGYWNNYPSWLPSAWTPSSHIDSPKSAS